MEKIIGATPFPSGSDALWNQPYPSRFIASNNPYQCNLVLALGPRIKRSSAALAKNPLGPSPTNNTINNTYHSS